MCKCVYRSMYRSNEVLMQPPIQQILTGIYNTHRFFGVGNFIRGGLSKSIRQFLYIIVLNLNI